MAQVSWHRCIETERRWNTRSSTIPSEGTMRGVKTSRCWRGTIGNRDSRYERSWTRTPLKTHSRVTWKSKVAGATSIVDVYHWYWFTPHERKSLRGHTNTVHSPRYICKKELIISGGCRLRFDGLTPTKTFLSEPYELSRVVATELRCKTAELTAALFSGTVPLEALTRLCSVTVCLSCDCENMSL